MPSPDFVAIHQFSDNIEAYFKTALETVVSLPVLASLVSGQLIPEDHVRVNFELVGPSPGYNRSSLYGNNRITTNFIGRLTIELHTCAESNENTAQLMGTIYWFIQSLAAYNAATPMEYYDLGDLAFAGDTKSVQGDENIYAFVRSAQFEMLFNIKSDLFA